jgi:hypothetical protein
MQKFSGIYMGKRRRQTREVEAETKGSGDDNEAQVLTGLAKELKTSIDKHSVHPSTPFVGDPRDNAQGTS